MQYLGIDWGTRRAAWCAVDERGELVEGTIPADEDGLALDVGRGADAGLVPTGMTRTASRTRLTPSTGKRAGTCCRTQASSVAASGAMPDDTGNDSGSGAGSRSMTVRRVSTVVPCRS